MPRRFSTRANPRFTTYPVAAPSPSWGGLGWGETRRNPTLIHRRPREPPPSLPQPGGGAVASSIFYSRQSPDSRPTQSRPPPQAGEGWGGVERDVTRFSSLAGQENPLPASPILGEGPLPRRLSTRANPRFTTYPVAAPSPSWGGLGWASYVPSPNVFSHPPGGSSRLASISRRLGTTARLSTSQSRAMHDARLDHRPANARVVRCTLNPTNNGLCVQRTAWASPRVPSGSTPCIARDRPISLLPIS